MAEPLGIDDCRRLGTGREYAGWFLPQASRGFRCRDGSPEDFAAPGSAENAFSSREINALRKKLGLSKAALARQIGINVNALWRWDGEIGNRTAYIGQLCRI